MAKLFISYRRSDTGSQIGRVYDRLAARYGRRNVFKDVDSIPAGVDFTALIQATLRTCLVQLVVIGPEWLETRANDGSRRLDDPKDLVRVEIETARRLGLRIIPVLLGDVQKPSDWALPQSLQFLAGLNAISVRNTDPDFTHDMELVTKAIDAEFASRLAASRGGVFMLMRWRAWILRRQLAAALAVLLIALSALLGTVNSVNTLQVEKAQTAQAGTQTASAQRTEVTQLHTLQTVTAQQTATVSAQATATAQILLPHTEALPGPCGSYASAWQVTPSNSVQCLSAGAQLRIVDPQVQSTLIYHGVYGGLAQYYDVSIDLANIRFSNQLDIVLSASGKTTYNIWVDRRNNYLYVDWYASTGNPFTPQLVEGGDVHSVQSIGIACHRDRTAFLVNGQVLASTIPDGGCNDNVKLTISGDGSLDLSNFSVVPIA